MSYIISKEENEVLKRIKKVVSEKGDSIEKFGFLLGISYGTAYKIYRGETGLKLSQIITICKHYNVEPNYLILGKGGTDER